MARRKRRGTTAKGKRKGTPARRNNSLKDPVVGYFAYSDLDALCEHDACIITGSKAALGGLLDRLGPEFAHYTVRSTTAAELLDGITQGALPARRSGLRATRAPGTQDRAAAPGRRLQ